MKHLTTEEPADLSKPSLLGLFEIFHFRCCPIHKLIKVILQVKFIPVGEFSTVEVTDAVVGPVIKIVAESPVCSLNINC